MTLPKILIKRAGEEGGEDAVDIPDLLETVKLLKDRDIKKLSVTDELEMSTCHMTTQAPSPPTGFRVDVGLGPSWNIMQVIARFRSWIGAS